MRHPILKTLLARLRAIEAVERASFALTTVDALMEPFERHRMRIALDGHMPIISMGECLTDLFGLAPVGVSVARLFRDHDRDLLAKIVRALAADEMAIHFGSSAQDGAGVPVALEGLLLPEPPPAPDRPVSHVSLCLIRSDFPSDIPAIGLLRPMHLGPTRYVTLENRGAERARLFSPRWPRAGLWHQPA